MQRNIDNLGRVVIPKEMRKQLGVNNGDPVNIELVDNKVILTNPSEVDYKSRCDKAIEYINENVYENDNGCGGYWWEINDKDEILKILKGE